MIFFVAGIFSCCIALQWGSLQPGVLLTSLLAGWKMADLCFIGCYMLRSYWRKCYARNHARLLQKTKKRKLISGWKRFQMARSTGFRCTICWRILPDTFHIDHIVPLSQNGWDEEFNWSVVCPSCHDTKSIIEKSSIEKSRNDVTYQAILTSHPQPVDSNQLTHLPLSPSLLPSRSIDGPQGFGFPPSPRRRQGRTDQDHEPVSGQQSRPDDQD